MPESHEINPRPRIAIIGGGTGSSAALNDLKGVGEVTALVNMVDDGGGTGVLRDQFGTLPPGDVRQCLVALSPTATLREVFNYRFRRGTSYAGQSFGNLFITALAEINDGDFAKAVEDASKILNIEGRVIPITLDNRRLVIETTDGEVIRGESIIGDAQIPSLMGASVGFDQPTEINPAAKDAIEDADLVVIAPGDLYTSIAPALAVNGLGKTILETKARVIYICNLVNKKWHTAGFNVEDYASEIERIIGGPALDYVVFNTEKPSPIVLRRYAAEEEIPVGFNSEVLSKMHYRAISGNFIAKDEPTTRDPDDLIKNRSLIRHHVGTITRAVMKIHWD